MISIRSAIAVIAATTAGSTVKPSWAANRAARIIRSGSSENESSGRARRPQQAVREVDHAAVRVDELPRRHPHRHRVHGEVAAAEVALEGVAEVDRRLARGRRRSSSERYVVISTWKGPLRLPIVPKARPMSHVASAQPVEQPLDLVGARRRGEVEVVVRPAEHRVAHRAADQGQLVPGRRRTALPSSSMHRSDPVELGRDVALGVGQPDAPGRSAVCCVGHGATA